MDAAETAPIVSQEKPPIERPPQPIVHWVLGVSLLLGVIGDALLRATPLGINALLFVGSLSVYLVWGWSLHAERTPCVHLLAVAFLLSVCLAWRDAPVLRGLDMAGMFGIMIVLGARPTRSDLNNDALSSLLVNVARGVGQVLKAPFVLVFQETDWAGLFKDDAKHRTRSIARGLALLIPTLLLFIWLFSIADAVFRHLIVTFIDNIAESFHQLALHILWTALFFLMVTLVLQPATLGKKWTRLRIAPGKEWVPGQIELVMVMGSVVVLFLVFIVIQFRYLFGGHDLVQTIPGLTYATYARKGFFALLLIVLLMHVVLLLGAWLVASADQRAQSLYRALSLGLVGETAFVFTSAYYRLYLYVEAYGLTQSRLYAAAVLCWLAVVFLVLTLKIVLPQWRFFTGAYVYSLLAVLVLLNVANPDGLIARINLEQSVNEHPLDKAYLQKLSTDAIPAVLARPSTLAKSQRNAVARSILTNRTPETRDWRSWNYSRTHAQKLLNR